MGGSMSTTNLAYVTGSVIQWARERVRKKRHEVAKRVKAPEESVADWERGKSSPTLHQAQELAKILHVPYGYLFLPTPPEETVPLPDFRTIKSNKTEKPSAELMDLLNDVIGKQQWYRDFLLDQGAEPLPFLRRFSISDDSLKVAEDIRSTLEINHSLRQQHAAWDSFLRSIIRRAESAGILVMRSRVAPGRRHLSVEEFRGFAISDQIAPLVFINSRDWPTAQLFTLAHELVHIWIGESGISNENLGEPLLDQHNDIEQYCNRAAAEVLVPKDDFFSIWNKAMPLEDNLERTANTFKVSALVAMRRAFDLDQISWKEYRTRYQQHERDFKSKVDQLKTGRGNYIRSILAQNGETFTSSIVQSALAGRVLYRDAARLLNVKVPAIERIAKYLDKPKEAA